MTETKATNKTTQTVVDHPDLRVLIPSTNAKNQTEKSANGFESSQVVLEQVSPHPYNVSYSCLIIPRFNSHYLIGDMADFLDREMRNICVSFAWRLEFIEVRPDYLQWIMIVPAATSPSSFMRIILQQTSKKIMGEFPRLKRENSSNDFWAPGYLVLVGLQPYPPEMIKQFIRLTRQQQGLPFD